MGRLVVVIVVLGIGIGGATMYRKPAKPHRADLSKPTWDGSLVLRDRDGEPPILLPREVEGPDAAPRSDELASQHRLGSGRRDKTPTVAMNGDRVEMPAPIQIAAPIRAKAPPVAEVDTPPVQQYEPPARREELASDTEEPPGIAPSFQQTLQPPLPELSTTTNRQPIVEAPRAVLHHEPPSRGDDTSDAIDEEDVEDGKRTYTIRDGDTLEKLAQRHLGDAHRASEIYELNRDRLARADLLPVGVAIELPPRRPRERRELAPAAAVRTETEQTVEPQERHPATIWTPVHKAPSENTTAPRENRTPPTFAPELVPISN